jgi:hypothetical protein
MCGVKGRTGRKRKRIHGYDDCVDQCVESCNDMCYHEELLVGKEAERCVRECSKDCPESCEYAWYEGLL